MVMRATSLQFVDQCPETPDLLRGQLLAAEEGSKQQAGGAVKDLVHQLGSGGGLDLLPADQGEALEIGLPALDGPLFDALFDNGIGG